MKSVKQFINRKVLAGDEQKYVELNFIGDRAEREVEIIDGEELCKLELNNDQPSDMLIKFRIQSEQNFSMYLSCFSKEPSQTNCQKNLNNPKRFEFKMSGRCLYIKLQADTFCKLNIVMIQCNQKKRVKIENLKETNFDQLLINVAKNCQNVTQRDLDLRTASDKEKLFNKLVEDLREYSRKINEEIS